ncbi:hypothetical protein DH2020_020307 [Rehmannia glutinosa]|uniref:Uncharacterized protein n=1 Tax=Rehmannia glutinosa TaxID=99300 RepID=A0ABR0WFQ6_REHGL
MLKAVSSKSSHTMLLDQNATYNERNTYSNPSLNRFLAVPWTAFSWLKRDWEEQRRYRARKRHEADMRKASIVDQSTPLHYQQMPTEFLSVPVEVEISVNLTSSDCLTRVHCQRDWKKDARRAHIHKKQETSPIDPSNSGIRSLAEADLLSDHSNTPP